MTIFPTLLAQWRNSALGQKLFSPISQYSPRVPQRCSISMKILLLFTVNLVLIRNLATCMQVRTCVPEKCRRKQNKLIEKQIEESEQYIVYEFAKMMEFLTCLRINFCHYISTIITVFSPRCRQTRSRLNCSLPEDQERQLPHHAVTNKKVEIQ